MDDLKKFQSDLDMLMVHTRRRMAMLDGVSRFLNWMLGHARTEDQMLGHFILPQHEAPRSPFLTAYQDHGIDAGFEPERVEEAPPEPPAAPPPPPPPPPQRPVSPEQMRSLRDEIFRPQGD